MKRCREIVVFVFLCVLASCQTHDPYAKLKHKAELQIDALCHCVSAGNIDSLNILARQQEDFSFYIFDAGGLVYWTSNRVVIGRPSIDAYDTWDQVEMGNATCLRRWTRVGHFNMLTIIPLEWNLVDAETLQESFSYRPLITQQENTPFWQRTRTRAHIYYLITLTLFAVILIIGAVGFVRSNGLKTMKLRAKFQYLIVTLLLACLASIFFMSVGYVRRHYARSQENALQDKCAYIQLELQKMYYWDYALSDANTATLNVDLRDLARMYDTDIHVYNADGYLIGSSTPVLFEKGMIARLLAPAVFFSSEPTKIRYEHLGKKQYLCAYTPFVNGNNIPIGFLAVPSFISEEEMAMEVDNLLARLLPPYLIFLLLTVFVSLLLSRQIILPISRLSDKLRHFELGGQDNSLDYPYHDELGDLVDHYNTLVRELEISTRKLAFSEREGAWRTMARQIAHEINNPLTPMKLSLQQLIRMKGTDRFDEMFDKASHMLVEQIDNLSHIATSFSTFAKMPEVCVTNVDVAARLSDAVLLQRSEPGNIPIRYIGPDQGISVMADGEQIQQVFINILKNAVQALTDCPNGNIIVILKDVSEDEVEISISDNGPGISEEIREKVFMPNFTTKSTGTGLGLAISKNIIEASGGRISFVTSDKGTTFYIHLIKSQK